MGNLLVFRGGGENENGEVKKEKSECFLRPLTEWRMKENRL